MAAAPLGLARCPLCGGTARASLSKNQLAVLTCQQPDCGIQLFTRSDAADERVRALILPASAPAPTPAPTRFEEPRAIAEGPPLVIVDEPPVTVTEERSAPEGYRPPAGFGLLKSWFPQP